ncbi:Kae1-associated serine/threonine protein kinase [Candidatus Woesearchaeota archaeon]|nr:Kae1-associated serine/threonine protein kinase [Candidatus Woesearchaeota archaeon]
MKLIAQGSESKLYLDDKKIVKNRFRKKYRIPEIDNPLRGFRTRREAKVLEKLKALRFPSPRLIRNDKKENLEIEHIKGKLVKDILDSKNCLKLGKEIGELLAIMHNNNLIHGDLTTSNMISNRKVYFIDFGLSFFSHKIEDMAVDIHLLKEALESKHSEIWKNCYDSVLKGYEKKMEKGKEILERVKVVESRGRYKGKNKINKLKK